MYRFRTGNCMKFIKETHTFYFYNYLSGNPSFKVEVFASFAKIKLVIVNSLYFQVSKKGEKSERNSYDITG